MASTSGAAAQPPTDAGDSTVRRLRWSRRRLLSLVGVVRSPVGGHRPSDGCSVPQPQTLFLPSRTERRCERVGAVFGAPADPVPPRPAPLAKPLAVAHYRTMARQVAYERQVALLGARGIARDAWFAGSAPSASGAQGHG